MDDWITLYHASKETVEFPEIRKARYTKAFKHPTHQISFHTIAAINCLTFERSEVVYDAE